jgi:hypothetical protein
MSGCLLRAVRLTRASIGGVAMLAPPVYWTDPGTRHEYPTSYAAYRRAREAEEKPLPRHRVLGPDIDHYAWRRRRGLAAPAAEVRLTFRPGAPPRTQRIVGEILRAIRRGQAPREAIRRVAKRFGLRHSRVRTLIGACLGFELLLRPEVVSLVDTDRSPSSSLADWV